jgi:hypothetical protein
MIKLKHRSAAAINANPTQHFNSTIRLALPSFMRFLIFVHGISFNLSTLKRKFLSERIDQVLYVVKVVVKHRNVNRMIAALDAMNVSITNFNTNPACFLTELQR